MALSQATAALYLYEAIALVNWNAATWTLSGDRNAFRASLKSMAQGSLSYLLGDLQLTNTGARRWKYRANVGTCSSLGANKDRWDDISHARHIVEFLAFLHTGC